MVGYENVRRQAKSPKISPTSSEYSVVRKLIISATLYLNQVVDERQPVLKREKRGLGRDKDGIMIFQVQLSLPISANHLALD